MTDTEPNPSDTPAPQDATDETTEPITGTADPSGVDAPADGPVGPSVTQDPVEGDLRVSFTAKNDEEEFPSSVFVTGTDDPDEARRFVITAVTNAHPDVEILNVSVDVVSDAETTAAADDETVDSEPDPSV